MARILIITKNYPPIICGVGDHSFHLKLEWERMGHEVFIFTGSKGEDRAGIIRSSKTNFSSAIGVELQDIIKKLSVDIVFWQYVPYSYQQKGLAYWWPSVINDLSKTAARQFIFFHEVSLRVRGYGLKQTMLAIAQQRIANRAISMADGAFTNVPLYQRYFKKTVPALVPVSSNIPSNSGSIAPVKNRVVCFANRVDLALLEAISMVREHIPVQLLLCGTIGETQEKLLSTWQKNNGEATWLRLTGQMEAGELAAIIGSAHVFIQPQITERKNEGGISTKNGTMMAAMSLGRPIITCKGDMTDENLFRAEENLLFVPYGDAAEYRNALTRLLTNDALADKLGNAARETYQRYCSWEITAGQLAAHF